MSKKELADIQTWLVLGFGAFVFFAFPRTLPGCRLIDFTRGLIPATITGRPDVQWSCAPGTLFRSAAAFLAVMIALSIQRTVSK